MRRMRLVRMFPAIAMAIVLGMALAACGGTSAADTTLSNLPGFLGASAEQQIEELESHQRLVAGEGSWSGVPSGFDADLEYFQISLVDDGVYFNRDDLANGAICRSALINYSVSEDLAHSQQEAISMAEALFGLRDPLESVEVIEWSSGDIYRLIGKCTINGQEGVWVIVASKNPTRDVFNVVVNCCPLESTSASTYDEFLALETNGS